MFGKSNEKTILEAIKTIIKSKPELVYHKDRNGTYILNHVLQEYVMNTANMSPGTFRDTVENMAMKGQLILNIGDDDGAYLSLSDSVRW